MIRTVASRTRRALKWLAHKAVFPAVESGWSALFLVAGLTLRLRSTKVTPAESDRVLVIAPHPDDETLGCGGTIARHVEAGSQVRVLIVTDGGNSRAGGISREEMRRLRAGEAMSAMEQLGVVDLLHMGLPEGRWAEHELQAMLEAQLSEYRSSLIYTTSCVDFHPEHRKVAGALAGALKHGGMSTHAAYPKVRVYELQVPLTPILANVMVDICAGASARKTMALACYTTQQGSFAWTPRHAKYLRNLYGAPGPVEVFWELDADRFCNIMEACEPTQAGFRSIRLRPFSDGLAWLVGWRARRRLKLLAEG